MDLSDTQSKPYKPNHIPILPSVDIYKWGLSSNSSELLDGLRPWPTQGRYSKINEPLSPLGKKADAVYNMGYGEVSEMAAQLDVFISKAFPDAMQGTLKSSLARYFAGVGSKDSWEKEETSEVSSWKKGQALEESWNWEMIDEG
jgi:hypothetical protein